MSVTRRDVDKMYIALRPRLGNRAVAGGGSTIVTIPPHRHSADQIDFTPCGDIEAVTVQEALCELAEEKLARDGHQEMLGDLDMGSQDIVNLIDIYPMRDIISMRDLVEARDVLSVRTIRFNPAPDLTGWTSLGEGQTVWSETLKTLTIEDELANVWPVQRSLVVRGYADGEFIEACKVVAITSGDSGQATFNKASNGYPGVHLAMGITSKEMPGGGEQGYAVMYGIVERVDTSAWAVGAQLYLGSNGDLTDAEPTEGCGAYVRMAIVLNSDSTDGVLFVRPDAMARLNEIADVVLSTDEPVMGDDMVFDPVLGPTTGDEFKVLTWRDGGECPPQWRDEYVSHPNIVDRSVTEAHPAAAITFDPSTTVSALTSDTVQAVVEELDVIKEPRAYYKHFMFMGAR